MARAGMKVYSTPHRIVHWLTAIIVFGLVPLGLYMKSLPFENPITGPLYEWHKSFGLTVLTLACIRVIILFVKGTPPPEPSLTSAQRVMSTIIHHLIYALIFITPLTGWIATSMAFAPVRLFFTIPVTFPISGTEATANAIYTVHFISAFMLTGLVAMHVGAAMYHLVIRRDGVFWRMWLFARGQPQPGAANRSV